jgi:hypothetical protein
MKYSKDPSLMESMIYALYLLEHLQLSGLDFIFKGGTSLLLLLDEPKRFSVDIDIILHPRITRPELEGILSKIVEVSVFQKVELDSRRSYIGEIPKAHYKFIFLSNFSNRGSDGSVVSIPEREILLDIVFEDTHYPRVVHRLIETEWLLQVGRPVQVKTPDVNSITGDKLTAYAPNTTGVPYKVGKEKEIIKQLFDIGCLFHMITDIEVVKKAFYEAARVEIVYRPERAIESEDQILLDVIETGLLIARKDILTTKEELESFKEISNGINQFRHFVFQGRFDIFEAQLASAKAAYLAALMLVDFRGDLKVFSPQRSSTDYLIVHPNFNYLNKRLKFVARGEALFYWFETINLLYPLEEA